MNPSSDQLKSCPFCGKAAKAVERNNPMSKWRWSVDCASTTCGMSGPVEATKFEAVEAWNRRSEVAESRSSVLTERLQAIIDWCDLALKNPQEFDSHGVRLLDGPVFDEARLALASPQPASTALVERLERERDYAVRWANKAVEDVKEHNRDRIAELETVLRSVEDVIFGSTLRVGSPEYFGVRKLIRNALSASTSREGESRG